MPQRVQFLLLKYNLNASHRQISVKFYLRELIDLTIRFDSRHLRFQDALRIVLIFLDLYHNVLYKDVLIKIGVSYGM